MGFATRQTHPHHVNIKESERCINGQPLSLEQRYYLLSLDGTVERFAKAVRNHWGIKNQVHWLLDVAFDQDASRIRKDHAPKNLALIERKPSALKLDGTASIL